MKYLAGFVLLAMALFGPPAQAQAQGSADATTEMLKLQAVFENISYTSFNVTYYYEEDDSSGVLKDTLTGNYRVNKDKYRYVLDSVEQIQNELYHATIDYGGKSVYVERPYASYSSLLQARIMDTTFQESYVDSMSVADSSGFRKITIFFKAESPYVDYQVVYDLAALRPSYVKFTTKKQRYIPEELLGPETVYNIRVHIVYSNYQTGTFDDTIFYTDWIFTRQNGLFVLEPKAFGDFELANAYDEQ